MHIFPVFSVSDLPPQVINRFLEEAYEGAREYDQSSAPQLCIVGQEGQGEPTAASEPPLDASPSAFLGQSAEQIRLTIPGGFFAVLDERSKDGTALLGLNGDGAGFQSVRVTFQEVQRTLVSLRDGTKKLQEVQAAARLQAGVLGKGNLTPGDNIRIFPVFCTAKLPLPLVNKFLEESYASNTGSPPQLCIVNGSSTDKASITALAQSRTASVPPVGDFTSPFLGFSTEQMCEPLPPNLLFAILDQRTAEDESVVVGSAMEEGEVPTIRATFSRGLRELVSFDVGTSDIYELQDIAVRHGGVLGWGTRPSAAQAAVSQGEPRPRKQLRNRAV